MAEISSAPTGGGGKRSSDAAFDLNLAPFLDIIVSIIPLLLLSAVFVEIKMVESPIPQLVAEAIDNANKKNEKEISISLKVSRKNGYEFVVTDKGKQNKTRVVLKNGQFDYDGLLEATRKIKVVYPDVFNLQIHPDKEVSFDEIIKTMDQIRRETVAGRKIAFTDPKSGKKIETDLMFPNVTFGNVVGD